MEGKSCLQNEIFHDNYILELNISLYAAAMKWFLSEEYGIRNNKMYQYQVNAGFLVQQWLHPDRPPEVGRGSHKNWW